MPRTLGTIMGHMITPRPTTTDRVSEFLHLAALAPAGVAACCVLSDRRAERRRAWPVELAVALLMFAAMLDVMRPAPLLAPVLWVALLLLGAILLGATTRGGTGRGSGDSRAPRLAHGPIHGALGCVVMAGLVMITVPAPGGAIGAEGHHAASLPSGSATLLPLVIGAGVLAYGVYSIAALRHGILRERIQLVAMGASTLGMAAAVLV